MAGRGLIRAVPALAGVLVAAIAFQLGSWQLRRAAEKQDLQARIERLSQEEPLAYGEIAAAGMAAIEGGGAVACRSSGLHR